jgi:hypothetical protein
MVTLDSNLATLFFDAFKGWKLLSIIIGWIVFSSTSQYSDIHWRASLSLSDPIDIVEQDRYNFKAD